MSLETHLARTYLPNLGIYAANGIVAVSGLNVHSFIQTFFLDSGNQLRETIINAKHEQRHQTNNQNKPVLAS